MSKLLCDYKNLRGKELILSALGECKAPKTFKAEERSRGIKKGKSVEKNVKESACTAEIKQPGVSCGFKADTFKR